MDIEAAASAAAKGLLRQVESRKRSAAGRQVLNLRSSGRPWVRQTLPWVCSGPTPGFRLVRPSRFRRCVGRESPRCASVLLADPEWQHVGKNAVPLRAQLRARCRRGCHIPS